MATWIFEPGHTEAGFRARHMMVSWVRGLFKDVHGSLELDWDRCLEATFQGEIDATRIWTGEPARDDHLRSADFLDVANHPRITFAGRVTGRGGGTAFSAVADVTIRGTTCAVPLDVDYHGEWQTPFWLDGENKGNITRIGFEARTSVNRHDFSVSWQADLPASGLVVGDRIDIVVDVEALRLDDLEQTGAIAYYREIGAVP